MSRIRGKNTKLESLIVRRYLHGLGFRFRLHTKDLLGRPDLTLARHKTVILVHGCFWHLHNCPLGRVKPKTNAQFWAAKRQGNRSRDKKVERALRKSGWRVLVIWECEIESGEYIDKLAELMTNRR